MNNRISCSLGALFSGAISLLHFLLHVITVKWIYSLGIRDNAGICYSIDQCCPRIMILRFTKISLVKCTLIAGYISFMSLLSLARPILLKFKLVFIYLQYNTNRIVLE